MCSSLQDSLNSEKEKSVLIRMAVILVAIRMTGGSQNHGGIHLVKVDLVLQFG